MPAPTTPLRRRIDALARTALVVAALGLGVTACAGERPSLGAATVGTSSSSTSSTSTTTTSSVPVGDRVLGVDDLLGYIATPDGTPKVRTEPVDSAKAVDIGPTTEAGAPTTFAVVGDPTTPAAEARGWYEVLLPTRPNGTTGWVPASSVKISKTPFRVFVDLTGRSLRVEDGAKTVMDAPIAIGTTANPTPTGATYVTELIRNTQPGGAYGPYAYGLALHSNTLTEFGGGDGQVGIHGTNAPSKIGQAVSHGCVRLRNDDIRKVVDLGLPLGVPVFIT